MSAQRQPLIEKELPLFVLSSYCCVYGIIDRIFGQVALHQSSVLDIDLAVVVDVGGKLLKVCEERHLRFMSLNRRYVVDVYRAVAARVAELYLVKEPDGNVMVNGVPVSVGVLKARDRKLIVVGKRRIMY